LRRTRRPIEISQPDGPGFTMDGDVVSWEGWTSRVGFDRARDSSIARRGAFATRTTPDVAATGRPD
jgi:primary-amine oxidase